MRIVTASAPGKVILFGEHAVVYGRPAIAVPVDRVQATAEVRRYAKGGIRILAPDLGEDSLLAELPPDHPLGIVVRGALVELGQTAEAGLRITVRSTIPIASGLGSGAAVSTAIVRALAGYFERPLAAADVSRLAFEAEKVYHGSPSGVDNTVIAYERPVYFVRDRTLETFCATRPFTLLIGDTGVASPTKETVGDVRRAWQAEPDRFELLFDLCAEITRRARAAIEAGEPALLGPLMDRNQDLLAEMGVSSPELEGLIEAARRSGALGAKLSGGGRGGNMIAYVEAEEADVVSAALLQAGARNVILTRISTETRS